MKERCLRKIFSISLHCCLWNGKLNAGTSFQSSFGCSFKIASNSNAHPSLGGGRGKYWKGLQMLSNVTPCMACQVHLCHYLSITICQRMSWVIWFEITFQTLKMGRKCAKTTNSLKFTSLGGCERFLRCPNAEFWFQNGVIFELRLTFYQHYCNFSTFEFCQTWKYSKMRFIVKGTTDARHWVLKS